MKRILITGAAGKIGNRRREALGGRPRVRGLPTSGRRAPPRGGEEIAPADLTDLASVEDAMKDVDCVVHLGAIPAETTGAKTRPTNTGGPGTPSGRARRPGGPPGAFGGPLPPAGFFRAPRAIAS